MNRRAVTFTSLVVATVIGFGSPALAGEITGNGKPTPIKARQVCDFETGNCPAPAGPANSFCAFSGLNDEVSEEEPHRTQSWGTDGPSQAGGAEVSAFAKEQALLLFGPGTACRGGFPELGGPE